MYFIDSVRTSRFTGVAIILFSLFARLSSLANSLALPAVADHALKVISPTILEVSLITTKDPDPAPIGQWNFVSDNFGLTLPDVLKFRVEVNSVAVSV